MTPKLIVAISQFPPLVKTEGLKPEGFEIELWEAIARRNGFEFEYQQRQFQEIIPLLAENNADIGLAGITITRAREQVIDFSHATLNSGLSILVHKDRKKVKIFRSIGFFFKEGYKAVATPFLVVLGFIVVFANLLWFAELGVKTFSHNYFVGIFESAWLVICSMSTDSFGDYVPNTWAGRFITTLIIIGGVAIFGLFIAQLSSFFAIRKIKGDINNYRDLNNKNVATVKGSTSVEALQKLGAKVSQETTIQEAYEKLKSQQVDAVVFDAPVLLGFAQDEGTKDFETVGELFGKQNYGIAMQSGSFLREDINQTILELRESGEYDKMYRKWFGENLEMEF